MKWGIQEVIKASPVSKGKENLILDGGVGISKRVCMTKNITIAISRKCLQPMLWLLQ